MSLSSKPLESIQESDLQSLVEKRANAVCNAAGWPKSMNYDDEGKWTGH